MAIRFISWRPSSSGTALPAPLTGPPVGSPWAPPPAGVATGRGAPRKGRSRRSISNPSARISTGGSAHERHALQRSGRLPARGTGHSARPAPGQEHFLSDGRLWSERLRGLLHPVALLPGSSKGDATIARSEQRPELLSPPGDPQRQSDPPDARPGPAPSPL